MRIDGWSRSGGRGAGGTGAAMLSGRATRLCVVEEMPAAAKSEGKAGRSAHLAPRGPRPAWRPRSRTGRSRRCCRRGGGGDPRRRDRRPARQGCVRLGGARWLRRLRVAAPPGCGGRVAPGLCGAGRACWPSRTRGEAGLLPGLGPGPDRERRICSGPAEAWGPWGHCCSEHQAAGRLRRGPGGPLVLWSTWWWRVGNCRGALEARAGRRCWILVVAVAEGREDVCFWLLATDLGVRPGAGGEGRSGAGGRTCDILVGIRWPGGGR